MKQTARGSILFVVEGERAEPTLLWRLFRCFGIEGCEIFLYGANLHQLLDVIDKYLHGDSSDYADLDILLLLREMERDGRARENMLELLSRDYGDIILLFDFEPHDNQFNSQRLERFMGAFGAGAIDARLYVNYPMLESYRDFVEGDVSYLESFVRLEDVKSYKHLSSLTNPPLCNVNHYDAETFASIIAMNVSKVEHLTRKLPQAATAYWDKDDTDLARRCRTLDLLDLMSMACDELRRHERILVCNTGFFFICEYWSYAVNHAWQQVLERF